MPRTPPRRFRDRTEAGRLLADLLRRFANREDVLVLALPRGGVPVGYEVATALNAPLDVFLVRKLGLPWHEEYAIGALASGGIRVMQDEVVRSLGVPQAAIDRVTAREQQELERRERLYRGSLAAPDVRGRIVILVDDGLATGSTMRAAARALRSQAPAQIVVAVPASAPDACNAATLGVDEVVCAATPEPFHAVGQWYENFSQTSDGEVRELLERARARTAARGPAPQVSRS